MMMTVGTVGGLISIAAAAMTVLSTVAAHTMRPEEVMPFLHRMPRHVPRPPVASVAAPGASATIAANMTTIASPAPWGDPVRVSWESAQESFLAIWCGPQANSTDWLDTVSCGSAASGETVFMLFDMRCTYSIAIVDAASHAVLASTNVAYANPAAPRQIRLGPLAGPSAAAGTSTTGVSVSFTTRKDVGSGKVTLRTAGREQTVVTATSTYGAEDLCGAPANVLEQAHFRDPGLFHRAEFPYLPTGTRFSYEIATTDPSTGEPHTFSGSFSTAAAPSDNATLLFVADMGTHGYPVFWSSPGATLTQQRLAEDVRSGASLVLHVGDVSYAVGHGYLWDQFMSGIEPIAASAVYAVQIGNHEYDWQAAPGHWNPPWGNFGNDSFGECGVPTLSRFPVVTADPQRDPWYVLQWGPARIVMMSSEHDWTPGSRQFTWLNETLGATDRGQHPWLIVTSHRPMYMSQTISPPNHKTEEAMRTALDPLINAHGVDLFLAGHWHAAERTCPVQDGQCFGEGQRTVHYTAGTGGCCLFEGYPFPASWDRAHFVDFSYLRLHVSPQSLNVTLVSSSNGTILDDYTLAR